MHVFGRVSHRFTGSYAKVTMLRIGLCVLNGDGLQSSVAPRPGLQRSKQRQCRVILVILRDSSGGMDWVPDAVNLADVLHGKYLELTVAEWSKV